MCCVDMPRALFGNSWWTCLTLHERHREPCIGMLYVLSDLQGALCSKLPLMGC